MVGNTTRFKLKMLMQGRRRQTPRPYRESQHKRYSDGSTLRGGSRTYRGATGTSWPGCPPLRLRDEKNHTFELSPLPIAENEGMADVGDVSQRPVDPIELYAYFLGLFLNNQLVYGGVIYPRYYMTFPVKFDRRTRDRILQGFRRGLLRSMPPSLIYGREWRQEAPFRIEEVASEPAAFAAAALPRLGIESSGDGTAFGVFDFGGGTTDFAFGLYRLATPEESEDEGWENVLDILDVAGDEQLGGEHLLDLAAYEVLRDNTETLLSEGIPFLCPHDLSPFTGSELLFTESATAQANMVTLRETLRPLWEEGRLENADTGTSTLNLFTREYKAFAPELKLDEKKLNASGRESRPFSPPSGKHSGRTIFSQKGCTSCWLATPAVRHWCRRFSRKLSERYCQKNSGNASSSTAICCPVQKRASSQRTESKMAFLNWTGKAWASRR